MNKWKSIPLGKIAEFRNGVNFDNSSFGKGLKVINVADFKDRMYPNYSLLGELNSASKWHDESYLKEGDIVFVRSNGNKNLIGRSIYIKNLPSEIKVTYSAFCIRLRFKNDVEIDSFFYLYVFKSPLFRALLSQFGNGANINNLNQDILNNIKIPVPNLPTQKKIASILSSYDDLIENNNQRIQLLEGMASDIYKEWFVRFRFPATADKPSYKNTKFVDKEGKEVAHGTKGAIPEGWEIKPVDEFESFAKSDSKLRKFKGEKRYLATADVTEIKISGEGEIIDWKNKPSRAQLKPELNSVFFARMSNTYKVLNFSESNKNLIEELALSSGFLGLKAKNNLCFPYLFTFIKGDVFHKYKDLYANGSTQVSLTNEGLHMIRLVEPSIELIEKFGKIVYPFYDEINMLINKNQILQETRDLLLPRLISGKLSVESLEVEEMNINSSAEAVVK
jgi:type I restriction enzyme S subunit